MKFTGHELVNDYELRVGSPVVFSIFVQGGAGGSERCSVNIELERVH
jgi:hypothetical protein